MNVMRPITVTLLHVLAWLIFGVGLLSPLTPSEGMVSAANLLIFAASPVVLAAAALILSGGWLAKLWATTEIGAIVAATSWLVWLQYRTS